MQLTSTANRPAFQTVALVTFGFQGLDIDTSGLLVKLKNTSKGAYRGSTYHGVPHMSSARKDPSVKQLITIGIGTDDKFPTTNTGKISKRIGKINFESARAATYNIKNGNIPTGEGYYYNSIEHMNGTVTVEIYQEKEIPYGGLNSVKIVVQNWQEALLTTAAHEAYHVYQLQRQLLGYAVRLSESDAEWYAHDRLMDWQANLAKLGISEI